MPDTMSTRSDHTWVQTFRGKQFWPLEPHAEDVFIDDIAHALSQQCRFGGHCLEFYSVAQHCVLVSQCAPPGEDPLWGLLHDAAEAYLVDLPRPVKNSPALIGYREAEAKIMLAICERFGLPKDEPAWVRQADNVLLQSERRDLMAFRLWPKDTHGTSADGTYGSTLPQTIQPLIPVEAERGFLHRFAELQAGRHA